jgi:RHS repeat-associated protein
VTTILNLIRLSGNHLLATLGPNGGGGEATQFHHPDRLGTRLVTDPVAGTSFEQVSLPFGSPLNAESTGSTNRRFTSYDRSPTTGLDYAVNRHYDPQQGRFTQVDPIGMGAASVGDPQSLNMYAYCGNDPVNHIDPEGLFWGKLWRAIKKIVTSKWFQIALAVAIIVIAHYYPNSFFGFGGGTAASHSAAAPVLRTAAEAAARQAGLAAGLLTAAPLEGAIAGAGIATAVSLSLAAAQAVGVAANLSAKARQKYDKAKDKVRRKIQTSAKCRAFLFIRGIVPNFNFENLDQALALQHPYDALHSTLTLAQAGLLPGSVETVQHYAANRHGLGAMTATYGGSTVASRSAVFFTGLGLRGSTILHEALHSFTGLDDAGLAAKLGVTVTSNNTQPISNVLKAHDCT